MVATMLFATSLSCSDQSDTYSDDGLEQAVVSFNKHLFEGDSDYLYEHNSARCQALYTRSQAEGVADVFAGIMKASDLEYGVDVTARVSVDVLSRTNSRVSVSILTSSEAKAAGIDDYEYSDTWIYDEGGWRLDAC
jgi:hypothetical protein